MAAFLVASHNPPWGQASSRDTAHGLPGRPEGRTTPVWKLLSSVLKSGSDSLRAFGHKFLTMRNDHLSFRAVLEEPIGALANRGSALGRLLSDPACSLGQRSTLETLDGVPCIAFILRRFTHAEEATRGASPSHPGIWCWITRAAC